MARYSRLGDPQATNDLLSVELAFEQEIEHTQSCGVSQGSCEAETDASPSRISPRSPLAEPASARWVATPAADTFHE